MKSASQKAEEYELREMAWVGDAVLSVFARCWILRHPGEVSHDKTEALRRLTSNRFLSAFGEPTRVEAAIGRIYQEQGEAAAHAHIETYLVPLFLKQMRNRPLKG